jgi:dihydrofolate synthase/folylpolyglutamate synthase
MCVDGQPIGNERLAELTEYVKPYADAMTDRPTEFELISAIAFEYFRREKCDVVILEAGMGGRLDSTNIIRNPLLSVITGIALAHTAFLGDTKEKIAYEKAGIIKTGVPVVYGGEEGSVENVIRDVAKERNAEFYKSEKSVPVLLSSSGLVFDCGRFKNLTLPLAGLYQLANAATVLKTIFVLEKKGYKISEESIRRGLALTKWKGRFERLSKGPLVYYDGGHNIDGVTYAAKTVKEYFTKNGKSVNLVFGVMADKDWREMVRIIAPLVKKVFCVVPDNPRALDKEALASEFSAMGAVGIKADSFEEAIREAVKDADVTLALGSLYMYSQVKTAVKKVL